MTRYVQSEYEREHYPDDGKACWELWHAELPHEYKCTGPVGHDGLHGSRGFNWATETKADVAVAKKFIKCYRAVPNSHHEIWLNDDGTVGMTMRGFEDATRFIGLSMHGGD